SLGCSGDPGSDRSCPAGRSSDLAPDGTEYRSTSLVTPRYSETSQQKSIDVGDTFFGEYAIPVPEDVDPAGHFVLLSSINTVEDRSEEHTSELQSRENLVCRLLLE